MLLIDVVSAQYLALVAGRTIPCVWNVFTAGLLQTHIFTVRILLAHGYMEVCSQRPRCARPWRHAHVLDHKATAMCVATAMSSVLVPLS